MTGEGKVELFRERSGWAAQSVEAVRPELPRWLERLRAEGITEIPSSPLDGSAHATNWLCMLARQGSAVRDKAIEHELHNITGVRH